MVHHSHCFWMSMCVVCVDSICVCVCVFVWVCVCALFCWLIPGGNCPVSDHTQGAEGAQIQGPAPSGVAELSVCEWVSAASSSLCWENRGDEETCLRSSISKNLCTTVVPVCSCTRYHHAGQLYVWFAHRYSVLTSKASTEVNNLLEKQYIHYRKQICMGTFWRYVHFDFFKFLFQLSEYQKLLNQFCRGVDHDPGQVPLNFGASPEQGAESFFHFLTCCEGVFLNMFVDFSENDLWILLMI